MQCTCELVPALRHCQLHNTLSPWYITVWLTKRSKSMFYLPLLYILQRLPTDKTIDFKTSAIHNYALCVWTALTFNIFLIYCTPSHLLHSCVLFLEHVFLNPIHFVGNVLIHTSLWYKGHGWLGVQSHPIVLHSKVYLPWTSCYSTFTRSCPPSKLFFWLSTWLTGRLIPFHCSS